MVYDSIVIGAGPAGTTAARFLAQEGNKVLLIEKGKLPRYKVCGGGLVWRAREALDLAIEPVIQKEFYQVDWKFSENLNFEVKRDYPLVTMVMRDSFDEFLSLAAVKNGAELHDEESFEAFENRADGKIKVITNKGSYLTDHLIAADGLRSQIYKQLKWQDDRLKIPAIEAELTLNDTSGEFFKKVVFDITAIEGGYGWIFPKSGHLSVGVAAMPRAGTSLKKAYYDYLSRSGIEEYIREQKQYGFQIPLYPHRQLSKDNILLVGDAAGLADPLVAEGISNAIHSGKMAARAINENPGAASESYDNLVKQDLRGQIRSAKLMSKIFYDYPSISSLVLQRKGQYITEYVSDIFAGKRKYPDNLKMAGKSIQRLLFN